MPRNIRRPADLSDMRACDNNPAYSRGDCNPDLNTDADRNSNSKSGCDRNRRLHRIRIPVPGHTLSVAQSLPSVVTTAERYRRG